jgi:hypothetical protein
MSENGESEGVRVPAKYRVTLVYDTATHQVAIEGDAIPISLGQMILDEGARVLEMTRRQAAALQLQERERANARVLNLFNRGRNG